MKSLKIRTVFMIGVLLCLVLLIVAAVVVLRRNDKRSAKLHTPELEYLKPVNSVARQKTRSCCSY